MVAMHQSNPVCSSCHRHIDPLGLALESYDALGFWDSSIDSSGSFELFSFSDLQDLQEKLSTDPMLNQCYAQVWLQKSLGSSLSTEEVSMAQELGLNMYQHDGSIPVLLSSLIHQTILLSDEE